MPIGGAKKKKKGGPKAAEGLRAHSMRNQVAAPPAPLIPRSTPPRSATAPAYQSPTKVAQLATAKSTPAPPTPQTKLPPPVSANKVATPQTNKLMSTATVPVEDIKDVKPVTSAISAPALPLTTPKVSLFYNT